MSSSQQGNKNNKNKNRHASEFVEDLIYVAPSVREDNRMNTMSQDTADESNTRTDADDDVAANDDDDNAASPNKKRKTTGDRSIHDNDNDTDNNISRSNSPERMMAMESSQETAVSSLHDEDDDEDNNDGDDDGDDGDDDEAVFYQCIGESTGRRRQKPQDGKKSKSSNKHLVYYNAIRVQLDKNSKPFVLRRGDAVQLWNDTSGATQDDDNNDKNKDNKTNNGAPWICRIESLFEIENTNDDHDHDHHEHKNKDDNASHTSAASSTTATTTTSTAALLEPHFTGRWFYSQAGLVDLVHNYHNPAEALAATKLLPSLQPNDLVLSNIQEENGISTIQKPCLVLYGGDAKKNQQDNNEKTDKDTYVCRFRLNWDKALQSFSTHAITEGSEAGGISSSGSTTSSSVSETDRAKNNAVMDIESDEDSLSARFQHVIQEGEGSTLRANISVGPQYQVPVGPFVPNQTVASRNPVCIWKPDSLSQSEMERFATDLAAVHTDYLRQEQLTILNEPYTPVRSDRAEQLMHEMYGEERFMTGSLLSSAASMLMESSSSSNSSSSRSSNKTTKKRRVDLRKECDVDSVLHLLSVNNYNTQHALASAEENLHLITTSWSSTEREIFDDSYRKNNGSLSAVAKALAPTKTLKQVIDYFYRFKIPDQFRIYQNKKREQAVHLMECIEKKRGSAPIAIAVPSSTNVTEESEMDDIIETTVSGLPADATTKSAPTPALPSRKSWTELTVEDTTHALQDRRTTAKKLLLEIDAVFGKDVLTKVAVGIERLHSSYDRDIKEDILRELRKQPELQRRLLEFLPRDV